MGYIIFIDAQVCTIGVQETHKSVHCTPGKYSKEAQYGKR